MPSEAFALSAGVPLVDVYRGDNLESIHNGSLVVIGADGTVTHSVGSVQTPVFPRSSNKPVQALAMLRAGLPSTDAELALACASHSGEPPHVQGVQRLLQRAGLDESALQCPPDWPMEAKARNAAIRSESGPRRVFMNCSGKHAAMLLTCVEAGWPTDSYLDPAHPLQQAMLAEIATLSGERVAAVSVDGCGAPVMAISLLALARAFSRLVQADPGSDRRRITDAMRGFPFYVAGTGREDTDLMQAVPGLLVKGGAEGVHVVALADGRTVALKVDDGASRPRVPLLLAALQHLGVAADLLGAVQPEAVLGGGAPIGNLAVRDGVLPPPD